MAVLGKTTVGLTDFSSANTLSYVSGPYLASEGGTIDSVSVYTTTAGVGLRMGVYVHDETTDRPTTLIASTNSVTTVSGWNTSARTSGDGLIEQGKRYWLAFTADATITYRLNNTEERQHWNQTAGAGFTLRNPFLIGGGSTQGRAISAYFTYTPTAPAIDDNSLQAQINRATPGSTVRIRAGFYNQRLVINKPLTLVGVPDRRGRLPVIQGGELVTDWILSTAPEHSGKNVWYKDIRIGTAVAVWIRSLQLGDKGVQILQYQPNLAGEGVDATAATATRTHVLTCDWDHSPLYSIPTSPSDTINFWQWYDAIACHDSTGRLWLRLKNDVNPNNVPCYVTATQNVRATITDRYLSNQLATVISCENQTGVTIRNLEVRGGRYGIEFQDCTNVTIENCKVVTPALRSINISDCTNVTIQGNELTSNRMRSNMGPGFGGTTQSGDAGVRARAMAFGWSLNKNYSVSGYPSPAGHSIELCGVTSNATIRRNWMHGQGGGVGWGHGNDLHVVDAVIENNLFETMDSNGIAVYQQSGGVARNNIFDEVHLNFRIQDMNRSSAYTALNRLVTIENNYIRSNDRAGYVLQAHHSAFYRRIVYSGGTGSLPSVGATVSYSVGGGTGTIVRFDSGDNVSGVLTVAYLSVAWPTTGTISSGGWSANMTSVSTTSDWTTPIVFNDNFVQNASDLVANVVGFADVEMSGNVIDTAGSISTALRTNGMESFTNNWVGGDVSTAPSQPWWGSGNQYTLNQRLEGTTLPAGFEQVGPYRQNVGLPIRRRRLSHPGFGQRDFKPWVFWE